MADYCKFFVAVLAALAAGAESPRTAPTLAALQEQITAHVRQPRFQRAHWGIHIVSLETARTLFTANADKLLVPASTAKLFVGALALDRLGPGFRVRTSLYAASSPDADGQLNGDLIVYGRGDPSFSVQAVGGDWERALAPLIDCLARAGVRQVTGDLVADESFFRGPPTGSGWEAEDLQWYYGAEVSALCLNDNAVDVSVRPAREPGLPATVVLSPLNSYVVVSNLTQTTRAGTPNQVTMSRPAGQNLVVVRGPIPADARPATQSVSVHRPAVWLGEMLKATLQRHGIVMNGGVRTIGSAERENAPFHLSRLRELGAVESPPLSELLPRMLKPSQNLHAQLWLFQAGAAEPREPASLLTSQQQGLRALAAFLDRAGIAADEVRLEEGSGLSRGNLVTPRALVGLLAHMTRHPHARVFLESLPVAGVDGTLKTRLRGTPAERNVRAKTGSMKRVNTLAGYVTSAAGEPLAFVLFVNDYTAASGSPPARADLDAIVVLLASLREHTRQLEAQPARAARAAVAYRRLRVAARLDRVRHRSGRLAGPRTPCRAPAPPPQRDGSHHASWG